MDLMDLGSLVVGVAGLVALVTKVTDFLRLLTNYATEKTSIHSQLAAWAAGVGGVFLYSASDFGHGIVLADIPLDDLGSASKVIAGLAVASGAGVLNGFKKAFDNSDSAAVPPMNL